jgi:hypothetical protein
VYRNSVDASRNLLSVEHSTSEVNQISAKSGSMQNGIAYCVVQVSFANGEEYRIEDYGGEAEELCKAARERSALLCLH